MSFWQWGILLQPARMYFNFLFYVKELDLFLFCFVILPELAVQIQLQEYSPNKEINGVLEIHLCLLAIFQ
jgi:hypothetical protein